MAKNVFNWVIVFTWMGIIFAFSQHSALQASHLDWIDFVTKKSAHFGEFFILNILFFRALKKHRLEHSIAFTIAYAFFDEIHQLFIPGRTALLRDVFIDSTGAIVAYLALRKWFTR